MVNVKMPFWFKIKEKKSYTHIQLTKDATLHANQRWNEVTKTMVLGEVLLGEL